MNYGGNLEMSYNIEEKEYYSNCCDAPPLYEMHNNEEYELLGMCMKCRDGAIFRLKIDEEEECIETD